MILSTLDYVFIALSGIICVFSFFTGFMKRLSGLAAAIVSCFAVKIALDLLAKNKMFTNLLQKSVICIALFIILFLVVKLFVKKAAKGISHTAIIGTVDKLLGFLCGVVISLAIITVTSVVIYFINSELANDSVIVKTIIQFIF